MTKILLFSIVAINYRNNFYLGLYACCSPVAATVDHERLRANRAISLLLWRHKNAYSVDSNSLILCLKMLQCLALNEDAGFDLRGVP